MLSGSQLYKALGLPFPLWYSHLLFRVTPVALDPAPALGDGDPGRLVTLSSSPSKSLRDRLSRSPLAPELHLLPSTAFRTRGLPLMGEPKPLMPYGDPAVLPPSGDPDMGDPLVLRSSGDDPNTAARVLLLRGVLRAYRGGVM
jgi:hypothetical protein